MEIFTANRGGAIGEDRNGNVYVLRANWNEILSRKGGKPANLAEITETGKPEKDKLMQFRLFNDPQERLFSVDIFMRQGNPKLPDALKTRPRFFGGNKK